MGERIAQRRRAERKVFVWGWSVAAVIHLAVFLNWRESREVRATVPNPDFETVEIADREPIPLELFFGPPAISNAAFMPAQTPSFRGSRETCGTAGFPTTSFRPRWS